MTETGKQVLGRILLRRSEDPSTPLERLNRIAKARASLAVDDAATSHDDADSGHGLSSDARSALGLRALDGMHRWVPTVWIH